MMVAAMAYEKALDDVVRGRQWLTTHRPTGNDFIDNVSKQWCLPPEVLEHLDDLREAAVEEYRQALLKDEKQRIENALKGWR